MTWKVALLAWCAGMPGIVAVALQVFPALVAGRELPAPVWVLGAASAAQGAALLAIAAAVGARLSPTLHLQAPALAAAAAGMPVLRALRPQLLPGVIGGLCGAALLWASVRHAPAAIAHLQEAHPVPLAVRLLYGGVTEEVLVRWGAMTGLAWLGRRVLQGGVGRPSTGVMALAIAASALIFGLAHLPAATAMAVSLAPFDAAWLVAANAAFGVLAGVLFWRHGLESAIIAHAIAHLAAFVVPG